MRQLLNIADKLGVGLAFMNEIRRVFPTEAGVPSWYLQPLLGWLSRFTGATLKAGGYLNQVGPRGLIDTKQIPVNFFLKRPDTDLCNYFFQISYTTVNPATGIEYNYSRGLWQPDVGTGGQLTRSILGKIREELANVAASAGSPRAYVVKPDSLKFVAAARTC